ncbi:MAG: trimethylamine methyltransferase family protein, partial [Anaerolineales bacterium]
MSQKILSAIDPKLRVSVLSEDEIRRIHTATMDVLETIGVRFPSEKALNILEAHGAQVDRETMIAKIPGVIAEEHLSRAPSTYTLCGLEPDFDLPLDGSHSYLGTDGCGVEIIDAFTQEKRPSTKRDVSDVGRVADALPEIAFHWVPLSAQDCPVESRGLHELDAIWNVSGKHLQTESIVSEREMRFAV